jgi:hypothetical protein
MNERINERGNRVLHRFIVGDTGRYAYDWKLTPRDGWHQFDTDQDAWYFGIWVHPGERRVVTFAEGDLYDVHCPTVESFRAELLSIEEFHGPHNGDRFTARDLDAMMGK